MKVRGFATAIASVLFMAGLFGCGSASNNDQGVSLLMTGFYPTSATTVTDPRLTGISVPFSDLTGTDGGSFGGAVVAAIGVQNNIVGQGVRLQRVFYSYYIAASSVQPPSTTYGLGVVLGPNGMDSENPSTLPPGYAGLPAGAIAQLPVVPFEIREWMVMNRNSLPEPPFVMDVMAHVTGVTSAGDRLDTNESILTVTVVSDIPIGGSSSSTSSSSSSSAAALDLE